MRDPSSHLCPRADAELVEDLLDVPLGGTARDEEPFRDLTIGKSVSDEAGHLPLPDRERGLPIASHSR